MSVSERVGWGWMLSARSRATAAVSTAKTPSAISSPAPDADDPNAQNAPGVRVEQQLRHPLGPIERYRPARGGPGEPERVDLDVLRPFASVSVNPHQATSGSVKTTAGMAALSNSAGSPANASTATFPSRVAL